MCTFPRLKCVHRDDRRIYDSMMKPRVTAFCMVLCGVFSFAQTVSVTLVDGERSTLLLSTQAVIMTHPSHRNRTLSSQAEVTWKTDAIRVLSLSWCLHNLQFLTLFMWHLWSKVRTSNWFRIKWKNRGKKSQYFMMKPNDKTCN